MSESRGPPVFPRSPSRPPTDSARLNPQKEVLPGSRPPGVEEDLERGRTELRSLLAEQGRHSPGSTGLQKQKKRLPQTFPLGAGGPELAKRRARARAGSVRRLPGSCAPGKERLPKRRRLQEVGLLPLALGALAG